MNCAAAAASPPTSRKPCAARSELAEIAAPKQPRDVRRGAFKIEPEVTVDNNLSRRYTVVEVSGLDRPGLLRDLTASLSSLNLNIGSAHIVTFGEKAVDLFYISDLTGQKINAPVGRRRSSAGCWRISPPIDRRQEPVNFVCPRA